MFVAFHLTPPSVRSERMWMPYRECLEICSEGSLQSVGTELIVRSCLAVY